MTKNRDIPPELEKMLLDYYLHLGKEEYTTIFWDNINKPRIIDLLNHGYENFKHTVATHYSQWLINPGSKKMERSTKAQLDFLISNLSKIEVSKAKKIYRKLPVFPDRIKEFNLITLLLWQYVKNQGLEKEAAQLSEPPDGSPLAINYKGRLISQSLAHSLLEFDSITKNIQPDSVRTILSIGPGYGRTAYVWMRLYDVRKFIFIDLPPALYLAQRYLSTKFPEKKVFKYRDFKSFDDIKDEYAQADLVFLMPWQIAMLPEKSIDLIHAIESFDEMNLKTIRRYLKIINKLGKKYFYMRIWEAWGAENGIIKPKDIPIPKGWKTLLNRRYRVQSRSFESLYQLPVSFLPSK